MLDATRYLKFKELYRLLDYKNDHYRVDLPNQRASLDYPWKIFPVIKIYFSIINMKFEQN